MPKTNALIVIPARWASTRFPGKPLTIIKGIPMLERVWKIANKVNNADCIVATDHIKIKDFCEKIGAKCVITSESCKTGSDRVCEALQILNSEHEIIFSFQGDAVLLPPWIIQDLLNEMQRDSSVEISTPAFQLKDKALEAFIESKKKGSSSGTCVTFDCNNNALYFSKSLIPFARKQEDEIIYRHIGLYAYKKSALLNFSKLPQGKFEKIEQLEQLRILEAGKKIRVVITDLKGRSLVAVDNPEDVTDVEQIIEEEGELF